MARPGTPPSPPSRVTAAIACLGAVTGLLLAPPIFTDLFAVSPLLEQERLPAWLAAAALVAGSAALLLLRTRAPRPVSGIVLALLVLVWIELGARTVVRAFRPASTAEHLSWLANGTYPEFMIIKGHPFLHYVSHGEGNSLGFLDTREFVVDKKPGVTRIACIGGSTTAAKWPPMLETFLNERTRGPDRFEVLDFGQNGYSSAHLVVNFALNVVDYSPDFLIVHSGWNDTAIRGKGRELKSDFSEVFKTFEYPHIRDRWLIRSSILYRGIQYWLYREPAWSNIRNALDVVGDVEVTFDDPGELVAFRRNIDKILDFARARDITVVLTTQPHSTDPNTAHFEEAKHLDQANAVMREIVAERGEAVVFTDLDALMTGAFNEHFTDLGHLDDDGRRAKADALAEVILERIRSRP